MFGIRVPLYQPNQVELRRVQRRMLRIMVSTRRAPEETWVEYIRRATESAEARFHDCGYESWVEASRRKKWRFAGKVAQTSDGRWSKRLLSWKPHFRCLPSRPVGRPLSRWDDSIAVIAGGDWMEAALDLELWQLLEPNYVKP